MQRINKKIKDKDLKDVADFVTQNAMGNVMILDKSPDKGQMKANTIGHYNNELFIKLADGSLKKVTLTDVP